MLVLDYDHVIDCMSVVVVHGFELGWIGLNTTYFTIFFKSNLNSSCWEIFIST